MSFSFLSLRPVQVKTWKHSSPTQAGTLAEQKNDCDSRRWRTPSERTFALPRLRSPGQWPNSEGRWKKRPSVGKVRWTISSCLKKNGSKTNRVIYVQKTKLEGFQTVLTSSTRNASQSYGLPCTPLSHQKDWPPSPKRPTYRYLGFKIVPENQQLNPQISGPSGNQLWLKTLQHACRTQDAHEDANAHDQVPQTSEEVEKRSTLLVTFRLRLGPHRKAAPNLWVMAKKVKPMRRKYLLCTYCTCLKVCVCILIYIQIISMYVCRSYDVCMFADQRYLYTQFLYKYIDKICILHILNHICCVAYTSNETT